MLTALHNLLPSKYSQISVCCGKKLYCRHLPAARRLVLYAILRSNPDVSCVLIEGVSSVYKYVSCSSLDNINSFDCLGILS